MKIKYTLKMLLDKIAFKIFMFVSLTDRNIFFIVEICILIKMKNAPPPLSLSS